MDQLLEDWLEPELAIEMVYNPNDPIFAKRREILRQEIKKAKETVSLMPEVFHSVAD